MSNTEFEGGDDRHGHGEGTFLVKQAQPRHATHVVYTKASRNVGKITFYHRRFKSPLFLWLIQILKTVTMAVVAAIAFFWSFKRNPAIVLYPVKSEVLTFPF